MIGVESKIRKILAIVLTITICLSLVDRVETKAITNSSVSIQYQYTDKLYDKPNGGIYKMNKGGTIYKVTVPTCGEVVVHIMDIDITYKTSSNKIKSCGMHTKLYKDKACKKGIGKKYTIQTCGTVAMGSYFLDAGTYYLKVWNKDHETANGEFKSCVSIKQHNTDEAIAISSIDNPNNLVNKRVYRGFLSQINKSDYYRIFVNSNKKQYVTIRSSISRGGKLNIYNEKKKKIKSVDISSKYTHVFDGILSNGIYYIELNTKDITSDTKLRVDIDNISLNVKQSRTPKYTKCRALAWGVCKTVEWSPGKLKSNSKFKHKVKGKMTFKVNKNGWYTVKYTDIHGKSKIKQVYVTLSTVKTPIITEYKRGTKKISGVASGCSKVVITVGNKKYIKSVKNGKYSLKVKKLKKGQTIKVYGKNKDGDISKTITRKVK